MVRSSLSPASVGQEAQPKPLFQPAHCVAQCRLGYAKLCRRTGETALAGNGQKSQQIVNIVAPH
jgi:hypothetical protein